MVKGFGSAHAPCRLALALVISAALHGALLAALSGHHSYPAPPPVPATLHVRLIKDGPATAVAAPVPLPAIESSGSSTTPAQPKDRPQRKAVVRAPDRGLGTPEARRVSPAVPRDPTWYSARELDELPRPLRPIRPPRLPASGEAVPQGRVVLQLAIDESGTVTDAIVVDASAPGDLAAQALAAGQVARFRPGSKGGRIVKSRVLLELTFGARDAAGS